MQEQDAIPLVVFDDEPQALPSAPDAAGPRPADRPRADPSMYPQEDPIAFVFVDSLDEKLPATGIFDRVATLPYDFLLFDPKIASFVAIYSAGSTLHSLGPRVVSIPTTDADSPITSITVHTRSGEDRPIPFLSFRFPQDVRGKRLTFQFTDPEDTNSLVVDLEFSQRVTGTREKLEAPTVTSEKE
jgi:hypothetical protein